LQWVIQGQHHLAPLVVGYPDDRHLDHATQREDGVLDLDRRDVLAAGDDHVLLAVEDAQVPLLVEQTAVAGVEPTAGQGGGGLFGLAPVPGHHGVRTGQHLTVLVDADLGADSWRAGPHEFAGPLVGGESVPLGARAVDGQER
jgi:hypothetical protein